MYITVFRNGRFYRETSLPPDDRPYVINWRGVVWMSEHYEIFSYTYRPFPWTLEARFEQLAAQLRWKTGSNCDNNADRLPIEIQAIEDYAAHRSAVLAYRREVPIVEAVGVYANGALYCYPAVFETGPLKATPNYTRVRATIDVSEAMHLGDGKVVAVNETSQLNLSVTTFREMTNGYFAGIRTYMLGDDRVVFGEIRCPGVSRGKNEDEWLGVSEGDSHETVWRKCNERLDRLDRGHELIK